MRKIARDQQDERQYGKGDQRQPPIHPQHDDHDSGEHEYVFEDREDAGGEHLVQRVDIAGEPGDQPADRIAVEEGDVHALNVAEDLAAHVEHDLLTRPLHQVGLDELEHVAQAERAEVESAAIWVMPAHGIRTELAGKPGGCRGAGRSCSGRWRPWSGREPAHR